MEKPVIDTAPSHDTENDDISLRSTYLRAVQTITTIPAVLSLKITQEDLGRLIHMCDGLLLSGGPDPRPFLFGEETQTRCSSAPVARDTTELLLLKAAMVAGKPTFGICRGTQTINVGLGGATYQDTPSQTERSFLIAHKRLFPCPVPSYHVTVLEGSLLVGIAAGQAELAVNNFHHQTAQTLAPGLTVSAYVPDGIIGAVEIQGYPYLLGMQWRPEHMQLKDRAATSIFRSFMEACRQREDYAWIGCGSGADQGRSGKSHGRIVARYDLDTTQPAYL